MPVRLNKGPFEFAKDLIREGRAVLDERDAWSEHQPSAEKENARAGFGLISNPDFSASQAGVT
jgi:hypothetical protein